ncbi:GNAT family N-acetyltransferase [Vreelandella nanhaiensis]|uniref:N-acetyltransferase n=1 Tax=Vreelandella nanhaiensis TaxID=1258546 RepID=A0A3S0WN73_9GAMM|nr:GNAT family N-acetyltransferase [Halomonas nanhaiensis]RUR33628.1 N-acetyltransferase [Halomonas nanhaiensis]
MHDAITIEHLDAGSPHALVVAQWTFTAWGHLHPGKTLQDALEETFSECGAWGVPSIFVAMQDEIPVGTASLIADDMSTRPELTPWLASVFVLPESRGCGIASALVQRVEAEAQANGIRQFYLYTPDQQALYQRLGWQPIECLEHRGENVTVMIRQLDI